METTNEVVLGMLKENTGRHMLDSGGYGGRAWERNQTRAIEAEEPSKLTVRGGKYPEIDVTHRTFHWLTERLQFSQKWQSAFDEYVAENDKDGREPWLALMEGFFEALAEKGHEVCRPYDSVRGDPVSLTDNIYNHECLLDQTLQFTCAEVDGAEVVLLQIHGGADVRGGYTAPKAFTGNGYSDWAIFDYGRATISCDDYGVCRANWMNDGGSSWWYDGGSGPNVLEKFKVIEHGEATEDGAVIEQPTKGIIYVNEQGEAFCPCCGKGRLHGSFY